MRFREVRWEDWSEDHIAQHGVAPDEVEDVVMHPPRYACGGRDGTTLVYGTTRGGRHLLVVVAEEGDGVVFVVTARDMNRNEQRTFRAKGDDMTEMTGMTKAQREELANYYSTHSTADGMGGGEWVNEPAVDPMVTTSLRLPVELMQAVRAMAAREGLKPTALMRRWVEEAVSGRSVSTPSGSQPVKDDLQGLSAKVDQVLGLLGNMVVLDAAKARRRKAAATTHPDEARTTARKSTNSTTDVRAGKKAAPATKAASTKTAAKKTAAAKTAAGKRAAPARTAARSGTATAETSTRTRASAPRTRSSR